MKLQPINSLPKSPPAELISTFLLSPSHFIIEVYGKEDVDAGLLESIRRHGVMVPLSVVKIPASGFEVVSGSRRLACARELGIENVPCVRVEYDSQEDLKRAVIEYNRQRSKNFSQLMREADTLEELVKSTAHERRLSGLRNQAIRILNPDDESRELVRRSSDSRTDQTLAHAIGLGGKDVYRQARAIWNAALEGDVRACSSVVRLDANQQTIHAAYKDLRRRDRYTTGFKPTPYDVWNFRGDSSYGIPHPGSIPPSIIAHTLHYYSRPNDLIVDPFAGGGATIDVSLAMGRRCLAYDLDPKRPDVQRQDVRGGFGPRPRIAISSSPTLRILRCSRKSTTRAPSQTRPYPIGCGFWISLL